MRRASRASERLSRVLVLDRAIDDLTEHHVIHVKHVVSDSQIGNDRDLAPCDGGYRAYMFLLSAFTIEALMWGFLLTSGGVFTSYYEKHLKTKWHDYFSLMGTLGTGIPFLGAPIITLLTARWYKYRRQMIWTGWIVCIASLVGASFSKNTWQLILTQGFGYGVGFLILYYAVLSMLNEWFMEKRGLAYGILFAAAGLSGTGFPFLTEYLLEALDYPNTLRLVALSTLVLVGPVLPFCKGRLPITATSTYQRQTVDWKSMLKKPIFYSLGLSNFFQGLSFYLPIFYVVSYAKSLNIDTTKGVLLFCVINVGQVVGQMGAGWLSDYSNVFLLLLTSNVGSLVACVFWFIASDTWHLGVSAAIYGCFAGSYSVLVTRFVTAITSDGPTGLWLYGVFAFQRGLGNVCSGPLATALFMLIRRRHIDDATSGYRYMIIFVACCLIVACSGIFGSRRRIVGDANSS